MGAGGGAIRTESPREPSGAERRLSGSRRFVSYEMVERGAAAPAEARRVRPGLSGAAEDPDRELVGRWQAGDLEAFEELVQRHEKRVFRLLLRMLGNREEAEDVAQETFLSLHRHGHRFRGEARFSTFVYRVAANAALNRRRTLGRNRNRTHKLAERQAAGDDLPTSPRDPEDATSGAELSRHVRSALETLSPPLRMPLVLYDIEGLAYGEIARVMGVAEGTVKSRIHRARLALRAQLQGVLRAQTQGVPT